MTDRQTPDVELSTLQERLKEAESEQHLARLFWSPDNPDWGDESKLADAVDRLRKSDAEIQKLKKMIEKRYADQCEGGHDPDPSTIQHPGGYHWIFDVWCRRCGKSGSFTINASNIQW